MLHAVASHSLDLSEVEGECICKVLCVCRCFGRVSCHGVDAPTREFTSVHFGSHSHRSLCTSDSLPPLHSSIGTPMSVFSTASLSLMTNERTLRHCTAKLLACFSNTFS